MDKGGKDANTHGVSVKACLSKNEKFQKAVGKFMEETARLFDDFLKQPMQVVTNVDSQMPSTSFGPSSMEQDNTRDSAVVQSEIDEQKMMEGFLGESTSHANYVCIQDHFKRSVDLMLEGAAGSHHADVANRKRQAQSSGSIIQTEEPLGEEGNKEKRFKKNH